MAGFLDYCRDYWQYLIALAVALVAAFFIIKKARKAYRAYYKRYRDEEARIKRLKELKERYGEPTAEVIENADENELLEGLALSYQLKLQKKENMEAEFALYSPEKQFVYTLDVFCSSESASGFFRENGRELTELIVPALEYAGLPAEAEQAERLRIMFDERDETTSINSEVIAAVDSFFGAEGMTERIKKAAAAKIKYDVNKFKVD